EANVPEMFASPMLADLVPLAKRLPSFAQKNGSIFVDDDSAVIYPIVSNYTSALHVARDELEHLMLDAWRIPVAQERALSIDVEGKVVRTDQHVYVVQKQILDCSGGAMLVASALGEVRELWPIHSSWRYFDVREVSTAAFWEHARAAGRRHLFIDIPNIQ